ncbi:hypothetical protein [Paenibacillus sp. NPDC057934]|uniref:hypothetical protein n=1 Tax=Paenibacillus sp. NPDC057934 TaxID=3346282 RepID=UPI0036D943C1
MSVFRGVLSFAQTHVTNFINKLIQMLETLHTSQSLYLEKTEKFPLSACSDATLDKGGSEMCRKYGWLTAVILLLIFAAVVIGWIGMSFNS